MQALLSFTVGLLIGAMIVKKNHDIDELRKDLEREKARNSPSA